MPLSRGRRRFLWVGVAVLIFGGAIAGLASGGKPSKGVEAALDAAQDESKFDSSAEAGDAFAGIASQLLDETRSCLDEQGAGYPPCDARSSGVAYAQVMAVASLTCTQPAIFEAREALLAYLRDVQKLDDNPSSATPEVPPIPTCT